MIQIRKLTTFRFYKNTPLTDLKNTIYFETNQERDSFFQTQYDYIEVQEPFNFIMDRFTIRLTGNYNDFKDINYCSFKSDFTPYTNYYCFIPEYRYINDDVIELNLLVDGIMTFCQGQTLNTLSGLTVTRQHLNNFNYQRQLDNLKNNDDVIKTVTKKYFYKETKEFTEFNILIHSAANLNGIFGTENNPNIETATGSKFDEVSSPVDLYLIKESDFKEVMQKLSKYPWITQNFQKIVLIPKQLLDLDYTQITTEPVNNGDVDLSKVRKIIGGRTELIPDYFNSLNKTNSDLLSLFDLDEQDEHLLRSEYGTIELYNYNGEQVIVNLSQLNRNTGLSFKMRTVGGYTNEIAIYLDDYKSNKIGVSSFLNDALFFKDFDDVPILVDNYSLALSQNANQRALAESNLFTGKVQRIFDKENTLADRLVSSVSILSNIDPRQLGNALVDEYQFYQNQKAQNLDLALESPTITNQSTNYSFNRKNKILGLTVMMSKPNPTELQKIKKYYKLYGYQVEETNTRLNDTRSMSICNYVQFDGTYNISGVERSILDIIKIRFENGVRLWHNNNTPNPFNQDIINNVRIA